MNPPVEDTGVEVRLIRWAVIPVQPGWTIDPDNGLIRDEHGTVRSVDDNVTVPPGTHGVVTDHDVPGQVWVRWYNGHRLALTPQDQWEVV